MTRSAPFIPTRIVPPALLNGRRAGRLIERNLAVYRRTWMIIFSGFFEPLFYLLSIGVGMGRLVGAVHGAGGRLISYEAFVAPGLMAASAMNGAVYDSTMNVYFKLKYAKVYDAVLATPLGPADVALGEIGWAMLRGLLYATVFLAVMALRGDTSSWWAALALPAASLIGFAFAAVGMAATSYMRSWADFDLVQLAVLPLFLFSATFYPLSTYPRGLQIAVQITPLYQGVAVLRALCTGHVSAVLVVHCAYLVGLGLLGLSIASRRLERLLLH